MHHTLLCGIFSLGTKPMSKTQLISEMSILFSKVHNKLNNLEKRTIDFGTKEKLFAAELHTIQAIGKKRGSTVTGLSELFGTTKGAVSQIISKLTEKKYVVKQRNPNNNKEITISLTEKGMQVFKAHEELHNEMDKSLLKSLESTSEEEIKSFLKILANIEKYVDAFLVK